MAQFPFPNTRSWLFSPPLSALDQTTNHPQVSQQEKSGYSTQPMGKLNQELSFRAPCGILCVSGEGRSRAHYYKEGECPELLRCRLYVHACSDSLDSGSGTLRPYHQMLGFPETNPVLARADKTECHRQNDLNNTHPSLPESGTWKSTALVCGEGLWLLFSSSLW